VGRRIEGFTIVEVLVAALVLSVGVLAFVGSIGAATRVAGKGRRLDRLGVLAGNEIEILRSRGCGTASGRYVTGGWEIEWRTRSGSGAVAEAAVAIRLLTAGTARADTFTATIGC